MQYQWDKQIVFSDKARERARQGWGQQYYLAEEVMSYDPVRCGAWLRVVLLLLIFSKMDGDVFSDLAQRS